jgi:excisionase family DNA binding protein
LLALKGLLGVEQIGRGPEESIPLRGPGDVLSLMTRQIVRGLVNHFYDKPPRSYKTPRGKLNEGAMSTQSWPVTPALSTNFESYVDCKRAAEFLSVDRKTIQRLSREGRIPAHPVLTGARKGRTTWRYKLSELDEWARTQQHSVPATRATSRREK